MEGEAGSLGRGGGKRWRGRAGGRHVKIPARGGKGIGGLARDPLIGGGVDAGTLVIHQHTPIPSSPCITKHFP